MKDLKLYFFGASLLLIIYLVAQYNRPKATDWRVTYVNTDKIPFGTYVFYNRLNDIFPGAVIKTYRETISSVITEDGLSNSAYIIICDDLNLNEYDYAALTKYISKGNNVFIAASYFGSFMKKKLHITTNSEISKNGQTYLNFVTRFPGDSTFLLDHDASSTYFSKFDTLKAKVLGKNGYDHASFIRINMGKGALFLNANPLMFTNYSLLQNRGAGYAVKALSYLPPQKGLAWDEYYTKGREGDESSMRVFLSHAPLRWAFYIVAFSLLTFVIYQSKRRQRIIPIIAPVSNTSVDFARTVGQVYYEQRNNSNIAQKKAAYFLEYLRTRYNLKTSVHDAELMTTLANKSGAEVSLIQAIFGQVALVQNGLQINDYDLIEFNRNIEQFYIQST